MKQIFKILKDAKGVRSVITILAFEVFIILLVVLSSYMGMKKINTNIEKMFNERLIPIANSGEIMRNVLIIKNDVNKVIHEGYSEKYDLEINSCDMDIIKLEKSYEKSTLDGKEKLYLMEFKKDYQQYIESWHKIKSIIRSREELDDYEKAKFEAYGDKIVESLNQLVEYDSNMADELNANSNKIYAQNTTWFGVISIIALILSLAFSLTVITIKLKVDIEKRLKDQEVKNLQVENMLKEAKLKTLQSQINPHFLFNTLNAVVQTAMIEGAYETEKLMNSVSDLLRYSLTTIDSKSNIGKEVDIIKQYIYIQETRFNDRIKFTLDVDESLSQIELPGMTLQPLVENSFIHGVEGKEEGGNINVKVWKENGICTIMIEDDGLGMDKERVEQIMDNDYSGVHIGHTTGIGVGNVIKRLKLFYEYKDIFTIVSEKNKGTKVFIKIPITAEGYNAKYNHC